MPRVRRVPIPVFLSPHQLFQRIRRKHPNSFLLESRAGPRRMARYSILGFEPEEYFRDRQGRNPLALAREILKQHGHQHADPFPGGLVGAIAYDAIQHFDAPTHRGPPPHYLLGLYRDAVVYNHLEGNVAYVTLSEDRHQDVLAAAQGPDPVPKALRIGRIQNDTPRAQFQARVREVQRRIRDGETYQTVLSRSVEAPYHGDLDPVYEQLRIQNPSPYMYYLDFDGATLVGSSPEMLVRVEGRRVETFPIAGTRPTQPTPAQDRRIVRELQRDPKERAEHLMLVDLARNDVGRVCRPGTVRVPEYQGVETYRSVHHLVSRVEGELAPGRTPLDAFESLFPAGTVTGAPKIRAMQLIDQLETRPRGFYAGAVGYFGLHGGLDAAITIRTLVANEERLRVQSGAGIVQDSRPDREYEETQHKARSILQFLGGPA